MSEPLAQKSAAYFEFLASRFPVMCASDEFTFVPRAQAAGRHYNQIDDLDAARITECLAEIELFRKDFDRLLESETDLESRIDLELLKANASGILIEFGESQCWRHNPLLYLKIAFIGLDHALTKPAAEDRERSERVLARLQAIPRLLQQGSANIEIVPLSYHQASLAMVGDCRVYLDEVYANLTADHAVPATRELQRVESVLERFRKFLASQRPVPDEQVRVATLEKYLRRVLLCRRSLTEIFQIAAEEWRENQEQIRRLQSEIHTGKSWTELYHAYYPADIEKYDTFSLYGREIERLSSFFREHGFTAMVPATPPVLRETPTYLRSVRSSASFGAALSAHPDEADFFFLSTRLAEVRGREAEQHLHRRLHREFRFLTAHETCPGHQLLDGVRRNLPNPVRRQVESPLFYEGWAYYAESLLAEFGYVELPIERLVDCKRRLWRAARCQVDVGLSSGIMGLDDAVELLADAGFSREEARTQVQRFRLNPGYQLYYSLGRYEILELRKVFEPGLGRNGFHKDLLEAGELPFHLAEQRLAHRLEAGRRNPENP